MAPLIAIPIIVRIALMIAGVAATSLGIGKFTKESEKSYFNKGVCKKCGGNFKFIEGTAVKGAKGYKCDVCDNCVWISFGSDKDYIYPERSSK